MPGGFPVGSVVKTPSANAGDVGSIPDLGGSHRWGSTEARASTAPEPVLQGPRAAATEPTLHRAHAGEAAAMTGRARDDRETPLVTTRGEPVCSGDTQRGQK